MKKIIHSHPNVIIATLALIFVIALVTIYSWAIGDVFMQVDRALASPLPQSAGGFDLSAAAALDLRGLMGGTTVAPAPAAPVAAATTTTANATTTATSTTP